MNADEDSIRAKLDSAFRKSHRGYSGARPDVVGLIEGSPRRVLDVGCGGGMTSVLVKEFTPGAWIVGLEQDPALAAHAAERMDRVITGNLESDATLELLCEEAPFDLIICADVLEHLSDPWRALKRLVDLLAADGKLISSIPNVRHISTFLSLGIGGTWPRRNRGIHDRSHLRFFARSDILELGDCAGLESVRERRNLRLVESMAWTMIPAKLLDFWPFRGFLTFQYLMLWRRSKA